MRHCTRDGSERMFCRTRGYSGNVWASDSKNIGNLHNDKKPLITEESSDTACSRYLAVLHIEEESVLKTSTHHHTFVSSTRCHSAAISRRAED